ncbi:hypothetical protein ACFX11_032007 [Malus domestica]
MQICGEVRCGDGDYGSLGRSGGAGCHGASTVQRDGDGLVQWSSGDRVATSSAGAVQAHGGWMVLQIEMG